MKEIVAILTVVTILNTVMWVVQVRINRLHTKLLQQALKGKS